MASPQTYSIPSLASWFHSMPRIALIQSNLHVIEPSFDYRIPSDGIQANLYIMSLLFYAFVCIAVCLTFFIIAAITSCCMCCKSADESKRSLVCQKIIIVLLSLLIVTVCAIGVYGNISCKNGVDLMQTHLNNIQNIKANTAKGINICYENMLDCNSTLKVLSDLTDAQSKHGVISSAINTINEYSKQLVTVKNDAFSSNHSNDVLSILIDKVELFETIRFYGTLGLLGWPLYIAIYLILSILCNSKINLILGSVQALIGIILSWFLVLIYLIGAMGVSDICINPTAVVTNFTSDPHLLYYINCPVESAGIATIDKYNSVKTSIKTRSSSLNDKANETIIAFPKTKAVFEKLDTEFDRLIGCFDQVDNGIYCQIAQKEYTEILKAFCYPFLEGIDALLGAALISCVSLFIVILMSACTWSSMGHRNYGIDYFQTPLEAIDDPFRSPRAGKSSKKNTGPGYHSLYADNSTPPPSYNATLVQNVV